MYSKVISDNISAIEVVVNLFKGFGEDIIGDNLVRIESVQSIDTKMSVESWQVLLAEIIKKDEVLGGEFNNLHVELYSIYKIGEHLYNFRDLLRFIQTQFKQASAKDALFYWIEKIGGRKFNREFTKEEIERLIKEKKLQELFGAFADSPGDLDEVLAILHPESFTSQEIKDLIAGFHLLGLGEGFKAGGKGGKKKDKSDVLIEALRNKDALLKKLSDKAVQKLVDIYQRQVCKEYGLHGEDHKKIEEKLQKLLKAEKDKVLKRILSRTIEHFRKIRIEVNKVKKGLLREPYFYQGDDMYFLNTHKQAILANEQGLGKTSSAIIAAEANPEIKKACIISTATMKEQIMEEFEIILGKDFTEDSVLVIKGNKEEKLELLKKKAAKAKYIIVNYDYLQQKSKEELDPILKDLDCTIVDEGQNIENVNTQRAEALAKFNTKYKWILSATPFRNYPDKLYGILKYLFPDQYKDVNSREIFLQTYCQDTHSLRLLHATLDQIMRRVKKADIFKEYEEGMPEDALYLPKRHYQKINYELSLEQAKKLYEINSNFRAFVYKYNQAIRQDPGERKLLNPENINPLIKLLYLFYAQVDPYLVGMQGPSALFDKTMDVIRDKLRKKEKIIIFTEHKHVINKMIERIKNELGEDVARIDGSVKEQDKKEERRRFQEDPDCKILIANTKSASLGLTLTAADNVLFMEKPMTYTDVYQAENRAHRVGFKFKKKGLNIITMVAEYPDKFLKSLKPEDQKKYGYGTPSVFLEELLRAKQSIYQLVVDGIITDDYLDKAMNNRLTRLIPGFRDDKTIFGKKKRKRLERHKKVVKDFNKLATYIKNEGEDKMFNRFLGFIAGENAIDYGSLNQALNSIEGFSISDLTFLTSIGSHKNKYYHQYYAKHLGAVIKAVYQEGKKVKEVYEDFKEIAAKDFLAVLAITNEEGKAFGESLGLKCFYHIYQEMVKLEGSEKNEMRYRIFDIVFRLYSRLGKKGSKVFGKVLKIIENEPLNTKVAVLEKLSILVNIDFKAFDSLGEHKFSVAKQLINTVDVLYFAKIYEQFELDPKEISKADIEKVYFEWGNFHQIFTLLQRYQGSEFAEERQILKRAVYHIFKGDFNSWRAQLAKEVGGKITYLEDDQAFWGNWQRPGQMSFEQVRLVPEENKRLQFVQFPFSTYLPKFVKLLETSEFVKSNIGQVFLMSREKKEKFHEELISFRKRTAKMASDLDKGRVLMKEDLALLSKWKAPVGENLKKDDLKEVLKYAERLDCMVWLLMTQERIASTHRMEEKEFKRVAANVRKISHDFKEMIETRGLTARKDLKDFIYGLDNLMAIYGQKEEKQTLKNVRIYDTVHPRILLEYGALVPEIVNCLNYNGNVIQNKTLMEILGDPAKRVIVVESDRGIEAVSIATIRQDKKNDPVIFIERGLSRSGYMFVEEMAQLMVRKAEQLGEKIKVACQEKQFKKEKDCAKEDLTGIGMFGPSEYVEARFFIKDRKYEVKHTSIVLYDKAESRLKVNLPLISLGSGNKTEEAFLGQLRSSGAKVLVDLRSHPYSHYFPQFNRKNLTDKVEAQGRQYVWLGEDLGGFQKGYGKEMEDFLRYREEDPEQRYSKAIKALADLAEKMQGRIALMCSETDIMNCHRQYVLKDLQDELAKRDVKREIDIIGRAQ